MKSLKVTVDTKLNIPYQKLHGIQGALNMMTSENFQKLRKLILDDGVSFAIHVWRDKANKKWFIIDGHGRHAVLKHLFENEGYSPVDLPCVEKKAESFEAAKKSVLASRSNFNTMTKEGLYEFMSGLGMRAEDLEAYELPEIDVPEFKMEFFDGAEPSAGDAADAAEKVSVSFDAYKNAAVKQVVLYFASDDYAKVIARLDELMAEWKLEDYSQVIWRMLSESNRPHA